MANTTSAFSFFFKESNCSMDMVVGKEQIKETIATKLCQQAQTHFVALLTSVDLLPGFKLNSTGKI